MMQSKMLHFFCTSLSLLFVSQVPVQSGPHLNVKMFTPFSLFHTFQLLCTPMKVIYTPDMLEHSLEVYMYTPVLTVQKKAPVPFCYYKHIKLTTNGISNSFRFTLRFYSLFTCFYMFAYKLKTVTGLL